MKNAYILLKPVNIVSMIETDADDFELEILHKEINCSCIQILRVKDPTGRIADHLCMVIDDEGKLRNKMVNLKASILYGSLYDYVVGNALICKEGLVDGEPDLIPLTLSEANLLMHELTDWR